MSRQPATISADYNMSDSFSAIEGKIAKVLAVKPECFITHPAELRILRAMSWENLQDLAAQRGWHMVRRVGGHQIEFYNDASARADR